MKKFIFLFLSLPLFASANDLNLKEKIQACQEVNNKGNRLSCYDNLFKTKEATHNNNNHSKWHVVTKTSPIDDSQVVVLSLNADSKIKAKFGKASTPSLILRCQENKTELYIDWDVFIGSNVTTVLTRTDKDKASKRRWTISTDHNGTFYQGKSLTFIKNLFGKDKLFAQVTPYGESPVNTTFSISGLESDIEPLRKACKW